MIAILVTLFISLSSGQVIDLQAQVMSDMTECEAMAHQHEFVPPVGPKGTFAVSYCKTVGE